LPAVPTTNLVARWQPDFSTITKSGSIVTAATDIVGSFDLAEAAAGIGAIELTETEPTSPMFGRKFWRFNGAQSMAWTTLVLSSTNSSIWIVARSHRGNAGTLVSIGPPGTNTAGGTINTTTGSNVAPFIRNAGVSASSAASGKEKIIFGCQPQVVGVVSGAGAASTRIYLNQDFVTVAGPFAGSWAGGQIGRYVFTGTGFQEMDVFDCLIYNAKQSNTDADATAAALQTGYGISTITDSLVLEGDSITQGINSDGSANGPSRFVRAPAGWRVLTCASSGATTAIVSTRQLAADSVHSPGAMLGGPLSGRNHIMLQIGFNDIGSGGRTAANVYNEPAVTNSIVSLIGNATNGFRLNYDKVYSGVNIATGNGTFQPVIAALRVFLRDITQFRTDTGCTTNLQIIDLPEITVGSLGGIKPFSTAALATANNAVNAPTTFIYQNDTLHPGGTNPVNRPGNKYMVQGGAWDGGSGDGYEAAFVK
jgi:lysophospholipase L1-like esterase